MAEALSREAILEIERLVKAAIKPQVMELPLEPAGHYAIVDANGEWTRRIAAPAPINLAFRTPDHLAAFVEAHNDEQWDVYISTGGITACDRDTRRERARCPFGFAATFQTIMKLGDQPFTQGQFLALLGSQLHGTHPGKEFVAKFRQFNWELNKKTGATIERGRESLSSEVKRNVYGEPPESVTLATRVFAHVPTPYQVECAIHLDLERNQISMMPLPNEVADAIDRAVADEHERLVERLDGHAKIQVFAGELLS